MFTDRRIRVILNPSSGAERGHALKAEIERSLAATGPAELEMRLTSGPGDFASLASEAALAGFDIILAAGGDGSVTGVAHGVLQSGRKAGIGIIPLGTGNGLARVLGLPMDPLAAIRTMQAGRLVPFDALDVPSHGMTSLLFLGAGLDAEINRDADAGHKSRLGFLAYVSAAFANLAGRRNHQLTLHVDGEERQLQGHTVSVFNATRLQLFGAPVGPDAHPHDGIAELSVMTSLGPLRVAGQLLRTLSRPASRPQLERVREVILQADPPLLVHIDGDVIGETPLELRVLPAALNLIAAADYRIPA